MAINAIAAVADSVGCATRHRDSRECRRRTCAVRCREDLQTQRGGIWSNWGRSSVIVNHGALLATYTWAAGRTPGSLSRPPSWTPIRATPPPVTAVVAILLAIGEPQRLQNPRCVPGDDS